MLPDFPATNCARYNPEMSPTARTEHIPPSLNLGDSINGGTTQWVVYEGNPIKMDDDWGYP